VIVDVPPPLLKSLTIRMSFVRCEPVKPVPPPDLAPAVVILFWKNQTPFWASPLLSKRSRPANSRSHFEVGTFGSFGQCALGFRE